MGRPKRPALGGYVYHVLNRANGRLRIFKKKEDFAAFETILAEGMERVDMRICGYCIMSNHWHMLLWPRGDADLSDYMRWITLTHTQRYHASHGTVGIGHLYQGRFKSFPTQNDEHYLTVLRYIEANPLRAEIVAKPGEYPWSSFAARKGLEKPFALSDGPLPIPKNWAQLVGRKLAVADQDQISNSIRRGAPLGDPDWVKHTAAKLNLQSTIKPRGRPKKSTGQLLIRPMARAVAQRTVRSLNREPNERIEHTPATAAVACPAGVEPGALAGRVRGRRLQDGQRNGVPRAAGDLRRVQVPSRRSLHEVRLPPRAEGPRPRLPPPGRKVA